MDLDLTLLIERPAVITDENNVEERSLHKTWERSNKLSLMFMQMIIANNIKSTTPKTESAKECMKFVKECSQFESADKSHVEALIGTLTTCKFDGTRTMH